MDGGTFLHITISTHQPACVNLALDIVLILSYTIARPTGAVAVVETATRRQMIYASVWWLRY